MVAVLSSNMVKIKYARPNSPKILAGHLVGSRGPQMARWPQFENHWLSVNLCEQRDWHWRDAAIAETLLCLPGDGIANFGLFGTKLWRACVAYDPIRYVFYF